MALCGSHQCFRTAQELPMWQAVSPVLSLCAEGGESEMPAFRGGVSRDVAQNVLFLSPAVPLSPGVFLSLSVL